MADSSTPHSNGAAAGEESPSVPRSLAPPRKVALVTGGTRGIGRATVEMLAQARARVQLPICVIGGITLENAEPLVAHGADLLAVVHGLFGADSTQEVTRRARAFNDLLKISV
jgi:hypothetical protein